MGEDAAGRKKRHWEKVYEGRDSDQMSWFQAVPQTSLRLINSALNNDAGGAGPAGEAAIVDVGGGASVLVDHLLQAGHGASPDLNIAKLNIAILDIAEAALDDSRRRLGEQAHRVDWIAQDLLTWTPARQYDLWHDRAVFHFLLDPDERRAYRRTLTRALRPGGHAIIATFALDGPQKCSGLPIRRYDAALISAELGDSFELLETTDETHITPAGGGQHFNYFHFQKHTA